MPFLILLALISLAMYPPLAAVALAGFWLVYAIRQSNARHAVLDKEIL